MSLAELYHFSNDRFKIFQAQRTEAFPEPFQDVIAWLQGFLLLLYFL